MHFWSTRNRFGGNYHALHVTRALARQALRTSLVADTMWRLFRRLRANVPALNGRRGPYRSSSRNST